MTRIDNIQIEEYKNNRISCNKKSARRIFRFRLMRKLQAGTNQLTDIRESEKNKERLLVLAKNDYGGLQSSLFTSNIWTKYVGLEVL